ncbi:MAG: FAD-dependent oxidoreductase [Actinobacteria bacterium]|nr:FAD-dependent oxidoreductase [Actinomycetota bacterium]
MAERSVDFLIVGAGVAGGYAARTLREEGAEGSVLLVGREPDPPYFRPALSKEYLAGEKGRADEYVKSLDEWGEIDVEVLTRTSVMKLDPGERRATLSNRDEITFGKALLATGANVRRLHAAGGDLDGLHYLRAFRNADEILDDAGETERVVLVGGSFIACEVAATLTALGHDCSIVMQEEITFERQFGPEIGRFFQDVLEEHGVDVNGGDDLERFEGDGGRVTKVVTKRGLELEGRCVVVGAGVLPDVHLARAAGLELGDRGGVRCSELLETSAPGVFAAGDIAEWSYGLAGGWSRMEHWDVAFNHGKTAAANMLGKQKPHEEIPYFWSDLSDWTGLEYVGVGGGERVIRGSLDEGRFTAFSLDDGRLVSALSVGRSDDLQHARRMIAERATPDPEALAAEGTDLAEA